jgi:hypothetical protein
MVPAEAGSSLADFMGRIVVPIVFILARFPIVGIIMDLTLFQV